MRFGSVCSGIEAASVAWEPFGWKAAWFSEIEPFPCAVLAHHYPDVPNLGDMTALPERILSGEVEAPDVFCGGTPCQAFSVAGLRKSLDDARGNLSLVFCEIANAIDDVRLSAGMQPAIIFWENVPGVLSTKDDAFGCFLGELAGEGGAIEPPGGGKWSNAGCVYGPKRTVAWRVLDAQYFGVAQRRRRVFVVASARNDFDPAAVLFEFDGLRRDTAPSRETGKGTADYTPHGLGIGGECARSITAAQTATGRLDPNEATFVTHPMPINTMVALRHNALGERTGFGIGNEGDAAYTITKAHSHAVAQPIPFDTTQITSAYNYSKPNEGDPCHPLAAGAHPPAIAFPARLSGTQTGGGDKAHVLASVSYTTKLHNTKSNNAGKLFEERSPCLDANSPAPALLTPMAVRRLTPTECERLQGFPDGYTAIPWRKKPASECPDGPRYKALGNSWAVPNVRWIGKRIQLAIEVAA